MLATDVAQPFIWAGAAALIAGVAWVLRKAGTAAVDDRIDPKLRPFYDRLDKHLVDEEAIRIAGNQELQSIHSELQHIRLRKDEEHSRIWQAIEDLRRIR